MKTAVGSMTCKDFQQANLRFFRYKNNIYCNCLLNVKNVVCEIK